MNTTATKVPSTIVETDYSPMISMIERAARDPEINIDKLERLITLQEKAQERVSEQAFNAAMSDAQAEMGPIATDSNNPQTKSRYASYFALDRALRPIYAKHGFALSFGTGEMPQESYIRVLCYTSHRSGFTRTYHIDMPADGKGAKGGDVMTKTHATGSAMSYGQRYLLKMIFNIAIGSDDDGNAASPRQQTRVPSPPAVDPVEHDKPHAITGGKGAGNWSELYLESVLSSDSPAVIFQWVSANQLTLDKMAKVAPEILAKVQASVEKHLSFLRKSPAKEDPISSGVAPKSSEGWPDYDQDYDAWVKRAIEHIVNCVDGGALESWFDGHVEVRKPSLFPGDYADLEAAYTKQQSKLNADE
jgi:ERF superfamily